MKISNCKQIQLEEIKDIKIDLLVCSSGYEDRATYLYSKLNNENIGFKIVFGFNDKEKELSRLKNNEYFNENKFKINNTDGDYSDDIFLFFSQFLDNRKKDKLKIIIDYSCMTRIWYAGILNYFQSNQDLGLEIELYFCYSLAKYISSPTGHNFNIHIGPIKGFTNLSVPQKPTALIIGLGYEENRATGVNEYFDGETFLFYSENSKEAGYSEEVELNNREIIQSTKMENVYRYPINDLNYTYNILTSLCNDLLFDYRVIIAPCGPKPYTLLSLLVSLKLENVDVWRISSGKEATSVNKEAEGEILIFKVTFS